MNLQLSFEDKFLLYNLMLQYFSTTKIKMYLKTTSAYSPVCFSCPCVTQYIVYWVKKGKVIPVLN
jgi:hypothetical protein